MKKQMNKTVAACRSGRGRRRLLAGVIVTAVTLPVHAGIADRTDDDMVQAALQLPLLLHGGSTTARAGVSGWFDRQADLRDRRGGGSVDADGGVWGRIHYGSASHEVALPLDGDPAPVNDYDSDIYGLAVGFDFMGGQLGPGRWLAGLTVGYTRSTMNFEQLDTKADFDSAGAGIYAAWFGERFFLDLSLRHDWMESDVDAPVLGILDNPLLSTKMRALTVNVEGGWRFDMGVLRVEPLGNLSWVRLNAEDMNIPPPEPPVDGLEGHRVMFDSHSSRRAGAGVRLSVPQMVMGAHLEYALTARYWREFSREADVTLRLTEADEDDAGLPIRVMGEDITLRHEADGGFSEVIAGLTLNSPSGHVSALLNAAGRFSSDYEAWDVTLGLRYQW